MLENSPLVAKGAIVKRGEELVHAVLALGFGLLQTADTANAVDESMRTAGVSQNDRHDDLIALRGMGNTDREGAVVVRTKAASLKCREMSSSEPAGPTFSLEGMMDLPPPIAARMVLPDFGCSIAEECSSSPSRPTMQPLP